MKLKAVFFIGLIIALIAGMYVYFFVWNKAHPDFEELAADYVLTSEQLYYDFVNDPENSATKYNGKMVQLTGAIAKLEKVDSLAIAVFVFNEGMFGDEGIRCTFLSSASLQVNSVEDLTGKEIKGFCSGFNDTDVILEKCSFVNK